MHFCFTFITIFFLDFSKFIRNNFCHTFWFCENIFKIGNHSNFFLQFIFDFFNFKARQFTELHFPNRRSLLVRKIKFFHQSWDTFFTIFGSTNRRDNLINNTNRLGKTFKNMLASLRLIELKLYTTSRYFFPMIHKCDEHFFKIHQFWLHSTIRKRNHIVRKSCLKRR